MNDMIRKVTDTVDKNTFLYLLHEEGVFDEELFREYIENVRLVNIENTEKERVIVIIERNEYILRNVLYHFLPDDLYVMKNFPPNMSDYVEQIHIENARLIRML